MTDAGDLARADAILEALSLERRPPDAAFFEGLFLRFQRRVATETLTRPAGAPQGFDAGRFFAEWVEEERGLVGEERARAFEWLAVSCGFDAAAVRGECLRPWENDVPGRDEPRLGPGDGGFSSKVNFAVAHRAVLASIEGRRILADAGFPLPVLLPLDRPAREIPTGMGSLSAILAPDGFVHVKCDARGEVAELLRFFPERSSSPLSLSLEELSRTSPGEEAQHDARGGETSFALRVLDDRVLFWRAGRMTVLDAWSRLEYPLPASERAALEKLFAIELEGVSLPEEPREEDPSAPATLSVFHLSPIAADEARGRVARGGRPLSLVASRETRIEESAEGSRITIEATLKGPLPPAGPAEPVRKTLVFHLVSELFELSRG
ncbi:MAG TPA: hypothetical protein VFZ57_08135 [Thermoanaerobaculia bacterium]|nr:hypothetical protein [Thermoanaerobaculia bacterium]